MRKEQARTVYQKTRMDSRASIVGPSMKYTAYFYRKSHNSAQAAYCFADPTLEFSSLEEARTFAQAAAATRFETGSFRITTDDRNIDEHWIRDGDDWKLIPNQYKKRFGARRINKYRPFFRYASLTNRSL